MTKKFTLIFILINYTCWSQVPNWTWGKNINTYSSTVRSEKLMCVDNNGNIYFISDFIQPSLVVEDITLTNMSETTYCDTFIIKYNEQGTVLWAKSFGGLKNDSPQGIATDNLGNFYVTGIFKETINFGTISLTDNNGGSYIAKFNSNGDIIWAKNCSETSVSYSISAIKIDSIGNIYLGGEFFGPTLTLDTVVLTYANYSSTNNSSRTFIAKLDTNGNCIWAKASQSNVVNIFGISFYDLNIDTSGNAYIVGNFYNNIVSFGSIVLSKTIDNNSNMYVVKYNSNGNEVWGFNTGSQFSNYTGARTVVTDTNNNVYVGGVFTSAINIGTYLLTSSGGGQMFLAKFDSTGNIVWAKHPTCSSGYNGIKSSDIDENGNIYIAGTYNNSSVNFGNNVQLTGSGLGNIFVVKYNQAGIPIWSKKAGEINTNMPINLNCKSENEIYVNGIFNNAIITFDNLTLIKSTNNYDKFLVKLNFAPLNNNQFDVNELTYYPNPSIDNIYIDGIDENQNYSIYDLSGKIMQYGTLKTESPKIWISELKSGIYLLKMVSESGIFSSKKIIKE